MDIRECYRILRLHKGASLDDVKSAFRKRAFELHPDLNPGNPQAHAEFQKLNEAYVLLREALAQEPPPRPGARPEAKPTADQAEGAARYRAQAQAKAPGNGTGNGAANGAGPAGPRPGADGRFFYRKEEVLKNILNDPFARKVFEDIYSQIRRGAPAGAPGAPGVTRSRSLALRWGDREMSLDLTFGLWRGLKGWVRRQMDDEQTVRLPAAQLLPGNRLRLQVRRAWSGDPITVEVPIPPDYVIGRALRLRGLGRKLGPLKGDLYLRLMAL
ncbi:J domain-containing protein [Desulfocurvus vexinensis]|uniref:J domain-containing protein n=1 Tax=Desulfocurvus vexinensis TaxID=399548 RepID=UPI00048F5247|nr:J domain-containing protein [Desulfocurvus vexinensis]